MSRDSVIRMPQLGLTMTEGLLVEWAVAPGQAVKAGDILYVVETDKIANEVVADRDGKIASLQVAAGETVPVGAVLGHWTPGESDVDPTPVRAAAASARQPAANIRSAGTDPAVTTFETSQAPSRNAASGRLVATPHARKLARARGLDLTGIHGSGPKGRIKASDVLQAASSAPKVSTAAVTTSTGTDLRRPLSATQQVVASRMVKSKQEVPHFYLDGEADLGTLLDLHRQLKTKPEFSGLTLTHWLVTAVGLVLAAQPQYRTVYDAGELLELAATDVGVAVATPKGLYVPITRNVGNNTLADNAAQIEGLVRKARDGKLSAAESTGGATCVSNLGGTKVSHVFPIIIPGHSTIIGVGRTHELFRPDAAGKPRLCKEIGLVVAADHRVHNGIDAARLLDAVITLLEDPLTLILANTRRRL